MSWTEIPPPDLTEEEINRLLQAEAECFVRPTKDGKYMVYPGTAAIARNREELVKSVRATIAELFMQPSHPDLPLRRLFTENKE